ncbi:hypothetical protein [Streptomyces chromofuscus]
MASIRRRAETARRRVAVDRRRAGATIRRELSAGVRGLLAIAVCEFADHAVKVVGGLLVHLGDAGMTAALRIVDQRQGASVLFAQLGQELGPREEDPAGQAGICMRTGLLNGQPAVAVGQGLGGDAVAGLGPMPVTLGRARSGDRDDGWIGRRPAAVFGSFQGPVGHLAFDDSGAGLPTPFG